MKRKKDTSDQSAKKTLAELIKLQRDYALTYRATTTEERYNNLVASGLVKKFTYDSEFLREPLIEHTGHLPVIAVYLHPKIEKSKKVDLGRALIMLSIHDLGETVTGDIITYKKKKSHEIDEFEAIKKLLPDYLFKYFEEFEKRETLDAKFAKSVDALAPELHELALPKVTIERFKHFDFNTDKIVAKKKILFEWDKALRDLFIAMIQQYQKMERSADN